MRAKALHMTHHRQLKIAVKQTKQRSGDGEAGRGLSEKVAP